MKMEDRKKNSLRLLFLSSACEVGKNREKAGANTGDAVLKRIEEKK
jgi:hypothetical protein